MATSRGPEAMCGIYPKVSALPAILNTKNTLTNGHERAGYIGRPAAVFFCSLNVWHTSVQPTIQSHVIPIGGNGEVEFLLTKV